MAQNNKGHARPGTGHDTANVSGTPRVEGLGAGIQLPSGGGALRGMGERFQANGFTGTGALHIPVPSTQSRSLSANLSLDYSSTGGQGIAGMGFALSSSAISRRTTHGVPKYDDTDVFVLDDNVLVADVGGATRLSLGSADYDVLRFRPRQEDHGLRIERWTLLDGARAPFWRIVEHDGTLRYFGLDGACRISDPSDPCRIFSWCEQLAIDTKGEAQSFSYKQEDAANITCAIYEQGRLRSALRHPERICYGNSAPLVITDGNLPDVDKVQWHYEIVFDYGEYDFTPDNLVPHTPVRSWAARPDPFSTYNAGFERRTHRLCRNIAMFHRFDEVWGSTPVLVHVTALRYAEDPAGSALVGVHCEGWRHRPGQPYRVKGLPELVLGYTAYAPDSGSFHLMRQITGDPMPGANAPPFTVLTDLYGEGLPGILYRDEAATRFWSPVQTEEAPTAPVVAYAPEPPRAAPLRSDLGQWLDLNSDGRGALVCAAGDATGYWRMASMPDPHWEDFVALPRGILHDLGAQTELADLSGTGRNDRVRIDPTHLVYCESLGTNGFLPPRTLVKPEGLAISGGPQLAELTGFADFMGAGTPQRFRIRDASIELWPSLGWGAFAACVVLAGAPRLGPNWDPARLQWADLDGSGCPALIYVHNDRVEIYDSLGGNGFAAVPRVIALPMCIATPDQVSFANVYGVSECLLVRQELPAAVQWVYDFCSAGKPYLLGTIADPMGSTTVMRYVSSTRFYLEDKAAGHPWVTRLPFPLQLVAQQEIIDPISDTQLITTFNYHHGYYDTAEREFRGFGMIEHTDVALPIGSGRTAALQESVRAADGGEIGAPTLTREWYELGVWELEEDLQAARALEFFALDSQAFPQLQTRYVLGIHENTNAQAQRQARIIAAGTCIRRELFALDPVLNERVPFRVQQSACTVTLLQAPSDTPPQHLQAPDFVPYGVFFSHERETVDSEYDGLAHDPRINHTLTLDLDNYGNVTRHCTIAYARRYCAQQIGEQTLQYVMCETTDFMPARDTAHNLLIGLATDQRSYHIESGALDAPTLAARYYAFDTIAAACIKALAGPVSLYGASPAPGSTAQLLSWQRTFYLEDSGAPTTSPLPAMQALMVRTETAAFADTAITALFAQLPMPGGLTGFLSEQAGYRLAPLEGLWWAPHDSIHYGNSSQFYRPLETRDAFAQNDTARSGTITAFTYDPDWLFVTRIKHSGRDSDVMPHLTTVDAVDYAGPEPRRITVNGLTTETARDPLGQVVAVSYHGNEWRNGVVCPTGFSPISDTAWYDWPEPASLEILTADPGSYLRGAAHYYFADDHAYVSGRGPVGSISLDAERYPDAATPDTPASGLRMAITYQDGMGRAVHTRTLAEPGDAILCDATGAPILSGGLPSMGHAAARWRCTGRVRRNNKGQAFEIYKPYFATTCLYPPDPAAFDSIGPPETYIHDALGRLLRAARPFGALRDAFYSRKDYGPWSETTYDENDTIKDSPYYQHYLSGQLTLPSWAVDALLKAAAFDATPSTVHFDTLDHPVRSVERTAPDAPLMLTTHRTFSVQGFALSVADPRLSDEERVNSRTVYSMSGNALKTFNADAGTYCTLHDINGALCYQHDGRACVMIPSFDSRHRVTATSVWPGPDANRTLTCGPLVAERTIYGDSLDSAAHSPIEQVVERNLFDRPFIVYDGAGRQQNNAYTLLGQPMDSSVRVRARYQDTADWRSSANNWPGLFSDLERQMATDDLAGAPDKSPESVTRFTYNALGQTVTTVDPHVNVQRVAYNVAGLPDGTLFTAAGEVERVVMTGLAYDIHGQQIGGSCVNAANTPFITVALAYDPDTQQMTGIRTTRAKDGQDLQNLVYWYDPVGNVTHIENKAQGAVPSLPEGVSLDQDYTYDALYRLTQSTGIALQSLSLADAMGGVFNPFFASKAAANYTLGYTFDNGGNLCTTRFSAGANAWCAELTVAPDSNRGAVLKTGESATAVHTWFDDNGNQVKTPDDRPIQWNWHNQIASINVGETVDNARAGADYFSYSGAAYRRRKTTVSGTAGNTQVEDQFDFGSLQVSCLTVEGQCSVQLRRTRHKHGNHLTFERLEWSNAAPDTGLPTAQERYQLADMLGSAVMEVDGEGNLLTYEHYAANGATLFATGQSTAQAELKRFRYSGEERDQTSGLYFYGARYLEPWTGRWLSPDPAGDIDGPNRYAFVGGNPASHIDIGGLAISQRWKYRKKHNPRKVSAHKSGMKLKRPSFTSSANKIKVKGTDLSHRSSWETIRNYTERYKNKALSKKSFVAVMSSIAPSLGTSITQYASSSMSPDLTHTLLRDMNSASENLRAGHSGRNRSIKGRFDSGVQASSSKNRSRSPSPVSKRQIHTQLEHGQEVIFFTRGSNIESSQLLGISVKDMQSSLEDSLKRSVTVTHKGNEAIFK